MASKKKKRKEKKWDWQEYQCFDLPASSLFSLQGEGAEETTGGDPEAPGKLTTT